ncbi:MAG: Na/Pi cotransporter family protein [Acidobacteriia bacterium]|nr:Na/Pi cotransporter family protein [Terriglobia bacterium]
MALSASELFFSITELLGGIGLFIYGMELMSREFQKTAGHRLRVFLTRLTSSRWSGLGIGTLLSLLIHSGPTTVMMVGFANAGLMDLAQSISIMFGANVGTTLSMQIISFSIDRYCFLAIFVGLMCHLVSRRESLRHLGLVVVGFGLLFLGMRIMSDAVIPLRNSGYFENVLRHTNAATVTGMLFGLLLSGLFTALVQSSGATIGILFALSTARVFTSIDQVFPLILGAHIGTCAPALIGSIGASISARRAALSHLMFNVFGAAIAVIMYRVYESVIPMTSGSLLRQIANTHTAVQVLTAMIFMPFTRQYAEFVTRIFPSQQAEPEKSHLDDSHLETPEKAIVAALKELQRMATITRRMLQDTMRGFLDLNPERFRYVRKNEEALDTIKEAVNSYLIALAGRQLSRRQSIIIQYLMTATADLERIGDHVDSIAELTREKMARNIWFTDDTVMDLIELYKKADQMLLLTIRSFEPSFYDRPTKLAAEILEMRSQYVAYSLDIKQKEKTKILEKKEDALSGIFFHRYVTCFNKIVQHSKTIALVEKEPFFFVKEHKLEKRSDKVEPPGKIKRNKAPYDENIFN